MMMKRILKVTCLLLLVMACGTKKQATSKRRTNRAATERVVKKADAPIIKPKQQPTQESKVEPIAVSSSPTQIYISLYSGIAQDEMRLYNIPASITLAQGILESSSGRGRLSTEANNHFGIKCHGWTGAKIYHDDDASQECFRKYKDAKYSFRDHSLFLKERKRYYKLFDLDITDYKGWAKELKAAGYATDRKYPDKLISLIERYELYKYDDIVLGKDVSISNSMSKKEGITHQIIKGDTLYSLSKRYNTTVENLKRLNNLNSNDLTIGTTLQISSN